MSNPASFPTAQFLAEHQKFVGRLALGLARDEAGAQDLVQETWLAALVNGTQAIVHPRAWLATAMRRRAANIARSESVRRGHEERSARDAASEDEQLPERVAFQHSIVAAVLALEEPYRSVVMLRYFQDLSPAAIARRRKIPASTVRSQLARAHAQLRARLEEHEGGRGSWCLAMAGFLEHSRSSPVSIRDFAVAASVCAITGGVVAAALWTLRTQRASPETIAHVAWPDAPPPHGIEPTFESARSVVVSSEVPLAAAAFAEGPSNAELGVKSIEELCDMLRRVEDELRPRLLTPPAEVIAAWQAEHADAAMEFARVLDRAKFSKEFASEVVGLRGGGAIYSFVSRSNDHDDEPTIGLDHGTFIATLLESSQAVLIDCGDLDAARFPAGLDAEQSAVFALLASGPALPRSELDPRLEEWFDAQRSLTCPLQLQHTYLLRHVSPNEHDLLAVFVPIHEDAFGVTLAWRVLRSWPVPDFRAEVDAAAPEAVLVPEPWTAAMSTDGLLLLLGRIRMLTTKRLMAIPEDLRRAWEGRPIARVLRDFFGTRFVNVMGGAVFFDFATQSNDYQKDPEFMLQGAELSAMTAPGHPALLFDLGATSVSAVDASFTPPQDEHSKHGWDLAWNFSWRPEPGLAAPTLSPQEYEVFDDFQSDHPVRAVVGHTYLVRKVLPGRRDQLVAFEIVAEDERGIFITWRVLKTWPL